MTLADIPAGTTVFVDANILVFALANPPVDGVACDLFCSLTGSRTERSVR